MIHPMKTLLLKMIVCGAALLPLSQVQAAGFGGFASGYKFKLTLDEKPIATVISIKGGGVLKSVPDGFPKFQKGDRVSFKIGTRGELIVANFSIPYRSGSKYSNVYSAKDLTVVANFSQAVVNKTSGKPSFMNLVLRKKSGSGLSTKVTQVVYLLD